MRLTVEQLEAAAFGTAAQMPMTVAIGVARLAPVDDRAGGRRRRPARRRSARRWTQRQATQNAFANSRCPWNAPRGAMNTMKRGRAGAEDGATVPSAPSSVPVGASAAVGSVWASAVSARTTEPSREAP